MTMLLSATWRRIIASRAVRRQARYHRGMGGPGPLMVALALALAAGCAFPSLTMTDGPDPGSPEAGGDLAAEAAPDRSGDPPAADLGEEDTASADVAVDPVDGGSDGADAPAPDAPVTRAHQGLAVRSLGRA